MPRRHQPVTARRPARALAEGAIALVVAVLLALGVRTFVIQTFWIPTSSMVPTLRPYDRILVLKAFFNWRDLRQGDIVVFSRPPRDHCGADGDLVKRVIALPGQTIYSAWQHAVRERAARWPSPTCRASTRSARRYQTPPGSTRSASRPATST